MQVATALAVSWKPLTNSKPSAISSAMPSRTNGRTDAEWTTAEVRPQVGADVDQAVNQHDAEDDRAQFTDRGVVELLVE